MKFKSFLSFPKCHKVQQIDNLVVWSIFTFFSLFCRRSFSQPRGRERRPSPPQPPPLPRMKSPAPDRRPYAWLEDDFGTNFGRKQEPLQPRIDRTPAAIRNPMLQPFRNGPEKVTVGWALI